jgi:hypothetical protein
MNKIAKASCVFGVLGAVFGSATLAIVLSACVDGTTPDCSNPDAGCNPSAVDDGSADGDSPTADSAADSAADTGGGDDAADGSNDGPDE